MMLYKILEFCDNLKISQLRKLNYVNFVNYVNYVYKFETINIVYVVLQNYVNVVYELRLRSSRSLFCLRFTFT